MKWVNVLKRLPPINEDDPYDKDNKISIRVLLYVENYGCCFGNYFYDEDVDMFIVEHMIHIDQYKVTHWAIVEPPKNKKNELSNNKRRTNIKGFHQMAT